MRSSIVTIACLLGSLLWDDSVALILPIQRFGARAERDGVFSINRRLSFSLAAEQRGFAELMSADDTVRAASRRPILVRITSIASIATLFIGKLRSC
jgi:hypothetical protein